jgi:hypothetical protein
VQREESKGVAQSFIRRRIKYHRMNMTREQKYYAGLLTDFVKSQCTVGWDRRVPLHELTHAFSFYLRGMRVPVGYLWYMEELLERTSIRYIITNSLGRDCTTYDPTRFVLGISVDRFVTEEHFARLTANSELRVPEAARG